MPIPSSKASAATKLKWLIGQGWTPRTTTVQGQYQVTFTHAATNQQRTFCGETYPLAVNDAFESLREHPGIGATRQERAL